MKKKAIIHEEKLWKIIKIIQNYYGWEKKKRERKKKQQKVRAKVGQPKGK